MLFDNSKTLSNLKFLKFLHAKKVQETKKKTQNCRKKLFIYQIAKNENNKTNKQTKLVFLKQNN